MAYLFVFIRWRAGELEPEEARSEPGGRVGGDWYPLGVCFLQRKRGGIFVFLLLD